MNQKELRDPHVDRFPTSADLRRSRAQLLSGCIGALGTW
jgi:hypothetical protein